MPRTRGRGRVRKHVQQPVPNIGGRNLNRDEPIMEPPKQLLQLPDEPEQKAGGEGTENGERDQARFLRMLDQHIELIRQHRAVINAHLSRIDHQGIDKEKENDQEFVEKFNEIKENNSDFLDDIEQTFQEHRRKELELNQREEDLKKRENTLNQKETALDEREEEYDNMLFRQRFVREREKYLHDLEKSLIFRESKLLLKK